ncbi:hypothetical protein SOVF_090380 [Spinacia oleracea]|nr:hypothetical protein SOVF_090380 [Spinacia oleracea]
MSAFLESSSSDFIYGVNFFVSGALTEVSGSIPFSLSTCRIEQESSGNKILNIEKYESSHQKMKSHLNLLVEEKEEKEELATLTKTLLELEEEKAVWSAK